MTKIHYSMSKPAGDDWYGDVTVKIVGERPHEFKMIVTNDRGLSFSKTESNSRIGVFFDLFMYFASLETVSLSQVKKVGFVEDF
jgi:hypothetical protein